MRIISLARVYLALIVCMTMGCSLLSLGAKQPGSLRIRAFIDGSDTINIRGDELWYEHHRWDLPGKWQGIFDEPTYVNGEPWKPDWRGSVSSPYQGIDPPFPKLKGDQITLTKVAGRGSVTIKELPSPDNSYTLSLFLDDDRHSGAEWYEVLVEW